VFAGLRRERFLRLEVIVETTMREPGFAHQLCDAHAIETVLLKEARCGLDYTAVIFRRLLFAQSHGASLP
jgi:hypothetical protein